MSQIHLLLILHAKGKWQLYVPQLHMTKRDNFFFQIYLIYADNDTLKTFIQAVHVPAYISTIISAADEGPDEMVCFPAGLLCEQ